MKKSLLTIIGILIFYFIVPVILGVILVKLFVGGHGTALTIIFFALITLEITAAVTKFIRYNKINKRK